MPIAMNCIVKATWTKDTIYSKTSHKIDGNSAIQFSFYFVSFFLYKITQHNGNCFLTACFCRDNGLKLKTVEDTLFFLSPWQILYPKSCRYVCNEPQVLEMLKLIVWNVRTDHGKYYNLGSILEGNIFPIYFN